MKGIVVAGADREVADRVVGRRLNVFTVFVGDIDPDQQPRAVNIVIRDRVFGRLLPLFAFENLGHVPSGPWNEPAPPLGARSGARQKSKNGVSETPFQRMMHADRSASTSLRAGTARAVQSMQHSKHRIEAE